MPDFTYENTYAYEMGQFTSTGVTTGGCVPYDYEWTFTDPNGWTQTSTLADPSYTFGHPGTYTVKLCVTGGCGEYNCATKYINATQLSVTAIFSGGNITVVPNTTVVFTDQSIPHDEINQWSWYWDWTEASTIGDITQFRHNYQQTVEHTYVEKGEYTVSLYVDHSNVANHRTFQTVRVKTPDYPIDDSYNGQVIGEEGYNKFGRAIAIENNIAVVTSHKYIAEVYEINETGQMQSIATLGDDIWGKHIAINGNNILAQGGKGLLLYEKGINGWQDMSQTYIIDNKSAYSEDIDITDDVIVRLYKDNIYVYRKAGANWSNSITPDIFSIYDNDGNKVELWAVAVDKNTIVATSNNIPKAYVFEINSEEYLSGLPTATLTMSKSTSSYGRLCSVDIENNAIIIGDRFANEDGIVYIFEKPEHGWMDVTETATLSPLNFGYTGEDHGCFGYDVSISGNYIAIGAYADEFIYNNELRYGAVYVYEKRPNESWSLCSEVIKKVSPINSGVLGSLYGVNVGLSGTNLIVSAPYYDHTSENTGCVFSYKLDDHYSMCYDNRVINRSFSPRFRKYYSRKSGNIFTTSRIMPDVRVKFEAITVTLKEGFRAHLGSRFSAKAVDCFELENSSSKSKALNIDSKSIDTVDIVKNVTKKFNILNFPELNVELNTGVGKGKKLELVFYNEIEEPYSISFYKRDSSEISLMYENLSGPKQLLDISTLDEGEHKVEIEISNGVYATKGVHILNK